MKNIKRFALLFSLILSAILLFSGCSSTNDLNNSPSVKSSSTNDINNTPSVKKLRKNVCEYSSSNKVDVSYTAPTLYIEINLSEDNKAPYDIVFDMVKAFTNESAIKEMSLGLDTCVYLIINTKSATFTYSTSYYKTNDNTDSTDNVINYKDWIEGCVIYHSN